MQSVLTAIDASDGNACLNAKVRTRSQTSSICVSLDLVRTFVISPKLTAYGAVLLALTLVAMAWTVSGQQVKRSSVSDAPIDLLHEKFDPEAKQLITSFEPENLQIFVDEDRLQYLGLTLRDLAHFLESQPFLFAVFTNDDVRRAAHAAKRMTPTRGRSKYK